MIKYYIKENYGTKHRYIVEPRVAEAISTLTGRKTLSDSDIQALEVLGFEFEQVIKPETEADKVKRDGRF